MARKQRTQSKPRDAWPTFRHRTPAHARMAVLAVIYRAERECREIAQKQGLERFDEVA